VTWTPSLVFTSLGRKRLHLHFKNWRTGALPPWSRTTISSYRVIGWDRLCKPQRQHAELCLSCAAAVKDSCAMPRGKVVLHNIFDNNVHARLTHYRSFHVRRGYPKQSTSLHFKNRHYSPLVCSKIIIQSDKCQCNNPLGMIKQSFSQQILTSCQEQRISGTAAVCPVGIVNNIGVEQHSDTYNTHISRMRIIRSKAIFSLGLSQSFVSKKEGKQLPKSIRYSKRQDGVENRQRVHGRFVKNTHT
jgi:hypothetical protein